MSCTPWRCSYPDSYRPTCRRLRARKDRVIKTALSLRLPLLVLAIWALEVAPAAAAATLSLTPDSGQPGTRFDAVYSYSPPPRSGCPAGSTVDFWWDAAGPGSANPPGAQQIGQATLQAAGCMTTARLKVPTSSCAVHTVYAYIDDGRGAPVPGTTLSARFTVTGCQSPSPSPSSPQPSQGSPQPPQGSPKPVQGSPKPVQGSPQPVQGSPQPVQGSPQPVPATSSSPSASL